MSEKLNRSKIEHFYKQIIECYRPGIKKLYWGDKDEFADFVEQADKSSNETDNIIITCKNGEEIELSRLLFDFLFKGENHCVFNHAIGQRYKYENYIFVEFIESPMVTINREKEEKSGVFPIMRDENGDIGSCIFIKSEKDSKNYDYPEENIPFFVSQMQNRLKLFEDRLPSNFVDHFEPMKYILKIKDCEDNLLVKLLYKLGINLGIVENSILNNQKLFVQQDIKLILDTENNINLTNEYDENLNSLKFYTSAIRSPSAYYRFLDAYHILESFFYKYFYNYVKTLNSNMDKAQLYDNIKKHISERQMLKLVIENCLTLNDFQLIKNKLLQTRTQELASRIGKTWNIERWNVNNTEDFASELSDLIYTFRNAIVHSKESSRHIERIEESPSLIPDFTELTNILLEIVKCVLEETIERW